MKKIFNIVYVVIFIGLCFCPLVVMPFSGKAESIGNEQESKMPSFVNEQGINNSFSTEFDDYFSKLNPFRTTLINAENSIKLDLMKSDSNGVISGLGGYLFSAETTDDYIGKTLSDREIYRIAKTVALTQQYAQSRGSNFVFTVVPNKNSVYPEYMPSRFVRGDENNLSKLTPYLENLGVNYLDLKSKFSQINDAPLYLKDDTHWNNLGAFYGYNYLMDALGREHKTYSGASYEVRRDFVGDLTKMAFPDSGRTCEQYYFDIEFSDFIFMQPARTADNGETLKLLMGDEEKIDGVIRTVNENAQGSLYILRDSFGRALLPYLIDNYQSAYITRYQPMNIQNSSYDDIVWEVVERNIDSAVNSAPMIFACACEAPQNTVIEKSDCNIIKTDENEGMFSLYGELDSSMFDAQSNIYALLKGENAEYCFEAYPVYEADKLGSDKTSDYGFSLAIDKNTIESGSYEVSLVVSSSDKNISTGVISSIEKGE